MSPRTRRSAMTVAARLLRQTRRSHNLTQRALAQSAATNQPSISGVESGAHDPGVERLDHLVAAVGHRLTVLPTRAQSAADAADAIFECLRQHDEDRAFRHLIGLSDDLASEHGVVRGALAATPPASVNDRRFDAALAALVEHHLVDEGLPLPEWVTSPERILREAWQVDPHARSDVEASTPPAFRRHGVLLAASEL